MMCYPIAIELATDTAAFGVIVPDFPGCFSAGDTLDEAMAGAKEAAAAWLDSTRYAGKAIPQPSSVDLISANHDFNGWEFGVIAVSIRSEAA